VKKYPSTAAEHLNVPIAFSVESYGDSLSQGFLTAYPTHKAVHLFLSRSVCAKEKGRSAFISYAKRPRNFYLIFLAHAHTLIFTWVYSGAFSGITNKLR
jgi:hypothetical protein